MAPLDDNQVDGHHKRLLVDHFRLMNPIRLEVMKDDAFAMICYKQLSWCKVFIGKAVIKEEKKRTKKKKRKMLLQESQEKVSCGAIGQHSFENKMYKPSDDLTL